MSVRRRYVDGRHGRIHLRTAQSADDDGRRPLVCGRPSPVPGVCCEAFLGEMGRDRFAVVPDTAGNDASDAQAMSPTMAACAQAMDEVPDARRGAASERAARRPG